MALRTRRNATTPQVPKAWEEVVSPPGSPRPAARALPRRRLLPQLELKTPEKLEPPVPTRFQKVAEKEEQQKDQQDEAKELEAKELEAKELEVANLKQQLQDASRERDQLSQSLEEALQISKDRVCELDEQLSALKGERDDECIRHVETKTRLKELEDQLVTAVRDQEQQSQSHESIRALLEEQCTSMTKEKDHLIKTHELVKSRLEEQCATLSDEKNEYASGLASERSKLRDIEEQLEKAKGEMELAVKSHEATKARLEDQCNSLLSERDEKARGQASAQSKLIEIQGQLEEATNEKDRLVKSYEAALARLKDECSALSKTKDEYISAITKDKEEYASALNIARSRLRDLEVDMITEDDEEEEDKIQFNLGFEEEEKEEDDVEADFIFEEEQDELMEVAIHLDGDSEVVIVLQGQAEGGEILDEADEVEEDPKVCAGCQASGVKLWDVEGEWLCAECCDDDEEEEEEDVVEASHADGSGESASHAEPEGPVVPQEQVDQDEPQEEVVQALDPVSPEVATLRHFALWAVTSRLQLQQLYIADGGVEAEAAEAQVEKICAKAVNAGAETWVVEAHSGLDALKLSRHRQLHDDKLVPVALAARSWVLLRSGSERHLCFGPGDRVDDVEQLRVIGEETLAAPAACAGGCLRGLLKELGHLVTSLSGHSQGVSVATLAALEWGWSGRRLPAASSGPTLLLNFKAERLPTWVLTRLAAKGGRFVTEADYLVPLDGLQGPKWTHSFSCYRFLWARENGFPALARNCPGCSAQAPAPCQPWCELFCAHVLPPP